MRHFLIFSAILLALSGCYRESAIQLGNDMMEIDVSAAPLYGRAGATDMAYKRAAEATVKAGYDKFIVMNNAGWNESQIAGASYGQATVNPSTGQASQGSFVGSSRHPEVKMVIRMYHYDDEGSEKAVDARSVLKQQNTERQ